MRTLLFLVVFCLTGCVAHKPTPEKTASDFYYYYLSHFDKPDQIAYSSEKMRHYVSADTLKRLSILDGIEEQDINESDYFSYGQDYDPAWVKRLTIGKSHPYLNGIVIPVSIGIENGGHVALSVFMRREDGLWKIYRVRDDSDSYEQPIFDAGRLKKAQQHAKSLPPR